MPEPLRCVTPETIITGWDFSTSGVKCLAFDLQSRVVAEVRLPTDLWTDQGACELNLMQLEGQARAGTRAMAARLRGCGRLHDWAAGGISATHHTAGRIDAEHVQVRRAICWNDQTLAPFHARGLSRLGGQARVRELIGGPWAVRYTLSHLVKDESVLPEEAWQRTHRILPHGPLAAGYLTGNFDVISVSAAASTGLMDLRSGRWCPAMLQALEDPARRSLVETRLPRIIEDTEPVGPLQAGLATEAGIAPDRRPLIFPTSDDQQAGLAGGGAVGPGQVAVILGSSAVVNSSSDQPPRSENLDAMRLGWGPYLWMRCYNNGAQFLDRVVGAAPDWPRLEQQARAWPPGAGGVQVWPFVLPEPSLGVSEGGMRWAPREPGEPGQRFRAAIEALAYLIAMGIREHEGAGQAVTQITVSGGIARSPLTCEILASVLDHRLERLQSEEGPALGAAATALAALETYRRRRQGLPGPYGVADAVATLVKFREPALPNPAWRQAYRAEFQKFEEQLPGAR